MLMRKLAKVLLVLALGAVICLPGMGLADVVPIGGPSGDWTQGFITETNWPAGFNNYEAFMTAGSSVFTDTSINSPSSWTGRIINPGYILFTGNSIDQLYFILSGTDVGPPNQFTIDFLMWGGPILTGTLLMQVSWSLDGSVWHAGWPSTDVNAYNRAPVPLPPTVLLLGSSLLGLAGWRRFRKG
jgi:hypothetical protein